MPSTPLEWSDLPVFLAIAREGTLGAAARKLGQSQPTMGRRLRALEEATGTALFQRTADGFVLTDEGAVMLRHAERMEAEAQALSRELAGNEQRLEGMLRLTCSDWFGRIVLAPMLATFHRRHPGVVVETLTDPRIYSLARREADLVLRIAPFDEPEVIARRLMTVPYALYAPPGYGAPGDDVPPDDVPVVVMDTGFGGMPDVGWLMQSLPGARIVARSNSREMQAQLCALGTGLAVLPRPLGAATPGLVEVDLGSDPPSRETWLGYHRDMKRLPRLRALVDLMVESAALR
ncbi:LysR family transcriptional regulator [Novosphingobium humi]|uniref:LysR family transcriptional regulator n=1 Tax=Novosphingobium humi TaxID=2282397 RepID=A0ABY7TWG2_9SPHN|nr:LysR family transcriptional regulator [Novosphingobium humi]WCT76149.1 LysR family transcriptional regulator [Novosphingobium humi]WJS97389.1 LysR family transcriptional regulator [Novosphingobium humi]